MAGIAYRFDCDGITTHELEAIFAATDLGGRKGDKIRRAFENSAHCCFAYDGERLIGTARAISDGEYHAFIYDVAVYPEYQGQGIGRQLVQHLLDRMPVWRVMLRADEDVQGFYRKHGFELHADVMARLDRAYLYN